MIFGYERNCFDKNNITDIVNQDFLDICIKNIFKNKYVFKKNWKSSVDILNTDNLIDFSTDKNFIEFNKSKTVELLLPRVQKIFKNKNITASGHFLYPKTGYMSWHTNYLNPCWRFYITYATKDKQSFFRYLNPITKQIVTDYDDKGITLRKFYVPSKPPYFWHCVGSMCNRFSFGFRIP